MKKTTKNYEFCYSSKEADESFSCEGVCLKHALIKFAERLASISDYSADKYIYSAIYSVDGKVKELSPDNDFFLQYYIQYSLRYKKVK